MPQVRHESVELLALGLDRDFGPPEDVQHPLRERELEERMLAFAHGEADQKRLNEGDRPGTHWLPAECDVSIRPGWFYHKFQDEFVKTPEMFYFLRFLLGVFEAGFRMTVFPAAIGPTVMPTRIASGKFHGGITAMTPSGSKRAPLTSSSSNARSA